MSKEPNKVVISSEDIKNIEEFFNHFRIPIPTYLQEQLNTYKTAPDEYTLDNQKTLKSELAHAIVSSDHELLKDGVFDNIISNCDKEWFETQFNRDLENELSEPKKV